MGTNRVDSEYLCPRKTMRRHRILRATDADGITRTPSDHREEERRPISPEGWIAVPQPIGTIMRSHGVQFCPAGIDFNQQMVICDPHVSVQQSSVESRSH